MLACTGMLPKMRPPLLLLSVSMEYEKLPLPNILYSWAPGKKYDIYMSSQNNKDHIYSLSDTRPQASPRKSHHDVDHGHIYVLLHLKKYIW